MLAMCGVFGVDNSEMPCRSAQKLVLVWKLRRELEKLQGAVQLRIWVILCSWDLFPSLGFIYYPDRW
jgi:hypothetical protein